MDNLWSTYGQPMDNLWTTKEKLGWVQLILRNTPTDSKDSMSMSLIVHDKFIPESEIVHYFNVADVVVLPYKTATQSGVIHKAYSYHKPVISSDLDGLREMIVDNETGLLFKSEDHEDLAEKIVDFYREFINKDYTEKIVEFNQNHSLEMFVKRLVVTLSN